MQLTLGNSLMSELLPGDLLTNIKQINSQSDFMKQIDSQFQMAWL